VILRGIWAAAKTAGRSKRNRRNDLIMRYPCRFVKSVLGKTGVIKRLKAPQKYELGAHYFREFYPHWKNPASYTAYTALAAWSGHFA
jgi:hypothetical protein